MYFISPFNTEETARIAGRQSLGELIANIRCTILQIVVDSEEAHTRLLSLNREEDGPVERATEATVNSKHTEMIDNMATIQSEHAEMLVNMVIALDEYRQCRGEQAVHDFITGGDTHD